MFQNLAAFLRELERSREIVVVEAEVDPRLEAAEIHRRVIAAGGPALLFRNPRNSAFPLVTNLFGTQRRVSLAFGDEVKSFVAQAAKAPEELMPPSLSKLWGARNLIKRGLKLGTRIKSRGPVTEYRMDEPNLDQVPLLTCWSKDGGPFVTLPLVYTEDPETAIPNLGMYRIQRYDARTAGIHWQIGKGGGFHYHKAEAEDRALPLTLFVGGPPALILSAIAPLPENVPELLLASLLLGRKLKLTRSTSDHPHPLIAEAEFAFQGHVPPRERRPEGPFGDHYGYYSLRHEYPVFKVETMFHRRGAVFPATVVGKPRQEDFFIGDFLQELLSPLFPVVMPGVLDLWSYGETGYHSLSAAVIRERYGREAMVSAFRILGEGQLSLTKFLLVVDRPQDLKDFPAVLRFVLERVDWSKDLYIFSNLSMDTLDYCGPEVNKGSKGVLLGVGEPKRRLEEKFSGEVPIGVNDVRVYCAGCLVLEGRPFEEEPDQAQRLSNWASFADFPLLVLVDDAEKTVATDARFLWTTFTRFEPAGDVYSLRTDVDRHHLAYEGPVCIDARIKPHYPEELFCDPETAERVTARWDEYFPEADVEMGDSDSGHLDE